MVFLVFGLFRCLYCCLANLPVVVHNIPLSKIFVLFSTHKFPQYFKAFLNKINLSTRSISARCFQAPPCYLLSWLSPKMSKGMQGRCGFWIVYVWNFKHRWCRLDGWPIHPRREELDFLLASFLVKYAESKIFLPCCKMFRGHSACDGVRRGHIRARWCQRYLKRGDRAWGTGVARKCSTGWGTSFTVGGCDKSSSAWASWSSTWGSQTLPDS